MRELTDEQRLAYARELANNPLLMDTLDIIRDASVETWDGTDETQTAERERCWWMRQAANQLKTRIENLITDLTKGENQT